MTVKRLTGSWECTDGFFQQQKSENCLILLEK